MPISITPIPLGKGAFGVNAYLLGAETGFALVDNGMRSHREALAQTLQTLGVTSDSLLLIIITHGDMDHIGNAAYLAREFGAPIAMHPGDIGMTRDGDMFSNRESGSRLTRWLMRRVLRLAAEDRFSPDIALDEGFDLSDRGLTGVRVFKTEGHSAGSVALLLEDGSLICGDVLENRTRPQLGSIMDDPEAAKRTVVRLAELDPRRVYPGHGTPFEWRELSGDLRAN